jgi:transcriptional regulator with XRE-family HTH domain
MGGALADEGDRRAAHNLRRLRTEKGLPLVAVGDALGVSYKTVNAMERGRMRVSAAYLDACARLFAVSVDEFFVPIGGEVDEHEREDSRADQALIEFMEAFHRISDEAAQRSLVTMARALAARRLRGGA